MNRSQECEALRAHALLTWRLVERAVGEGNLALARKLAEIAGEVDERVAAAYLGLKVRTLQAWRQSGRGPEFIRISSRCIRYTRTRLKSFADDLARRSTSDLGPEANGA